MHTSKDNYLINTLRFVFAKEATQIYGAILPESLTSPEMKETKAYKTYLGFATGATPPKIARKFKKASPSKKDLNLQKKVSTKKTTRKQSIGVVLRDTPVETTSKRKEKTHPSGSDTVTKTAPSAAKIKPSVTNEGTGVKPEVPDVTEEESTKSKVESWGKDEDDNNNEHDSRSEGRLDSEHETDENESGSESDQEENEEEIGDDEEEEEDEFVKTPSNDTDKEDETKIKDKAEGDEDEEMDYTTSQLYDDVDIRLNEPVNTDKGFIQKEGTDAEKLNVQQGNKNPEISQVIEDAHVTLSTVAKKTEVLVTSSSHSFELVAKFLNFSDIPYTDAEIVSPIDVHVHHEVPSKQTPTLFTVHVSVITESSLIYSTVISQSIPSFTPPPPQSTPTPPPTTEATNLPSALLDFASVFQFNDRVSALEKDVFELKKDDPFKTQVTAQVDEHLDARLGATRDEFMNYLSASITAQITEQVKIKLPQILPEEESSQPQSSYEAAASLTKFKLKKILIDKMDKSESYLAAPEHRDCYNGLIKSYDLDKSLYSTYDKVYSLKRIRKDKDKDEDPSAGSDRGLKKRKTSKDAEPTKGPKAKESQSGSSKGAQSQSKSSRKSVQLEEPEFEVADSDMPQDQEENPGNDDEEPKRKTPQQGPTQSWLMTLASSADKPLKTFDKLISTPIDFSAYIMNGLKITNLTQETLLGPAFRLLKGTRTNFAELKYDFEECYKALSEKLNWNNPEGGDYPFDLTKPLPLIMNGNRQNDKGRSGISHWREQRKTFYAYAQGLESSHDVYSTKRILAVTRVEVMRKHGYGYLKEIVVRRADNDLYKFKEGDFPRLCINDIEDMLLLKRVVDLQLAVESYQKKINVTKPETTRPRIRKKDPYTPYHPQGFIYVDTLGRNRLMRSDELYKFSDGTLTRLQTSLDDIIKNIQMKYLPKRR
ncbi:hypothetical protein Tco_1132230 [Tanacetum coccineum]|uniref:Uncharacterized protein n=1 Tax=Tanacetum coccineum TaxID=301880 RepID=A0ABQ5JBC3_9ASTR